MHAARVRRIAALVTLLLAPLAHAFSIETAFTTGCHERITVEALRRAGVRIEKTTETGNPIYHARFSDAAPALACFSKVLDQAPNPKHGFAAVMTCAQADAACPTVPGAEARFAIPYEDPKAFDGEPVESAMYDDRCAQIAREMLFAFAHVRTRTAR